MSTSLPTFSDGDIFDARDKLSATAARRYCGSSDNGFCSIPCCVTSAATLVPGSKSRPAPSSSSRLPQSTIPGNTWGAFTRFHSASPKTLSMSLSKLMHSVSPQTPTNMYSVPLNTLREDINSGEAGNVLEVVIRFNWAVRALARFIASARWDSASAACFLADAIPCSNESASFLASCASVKAFAAPDCAWSDCDLASFAASLAVCAESLASPASLESSETRSSLAFLISVSTLLAFTSMYSSPATPTATNPAPSSPNTSRNKLGLSGGCTSPRRKSCNSLTYSQTTKTTSSATPTTTRNVQKCSHP